MVAKTKRSTLGRTGLGRDRILAAALEIVDRDGLEALTMRSLAESLGVAPMATYRHFAHKGALLDALLDAFVGGLSVPAANDDWRWTALTIATEIRRYLLQHRGMAAAAVGRPSLGPSGVRLAEAMYGPLRGAGFDDRATERATSLVFGYALGFVGLEVPRLAAATARDPEMHVTQDDLADAYRAVDPALIPHTLAIAPTPGEFISDAQFEWGLAVILDGIAGRLPGR